MTADRDTQKILNALRDALPAPGQVISDPNELIVYECDGFTIPRAKPLAVIFPESTEQVVAAVNILRSNRLAIMPRGSGTGLTGGTLAITPGVQLSTARMKKI